VEQLAETEAVRLVEIEIRFDTSQSPGLGINVLDIWNGARQLAHFDGFSSRGPVLSRSFSNGLRLDPRAGLNLSIGVAFPVQLDGPVASGPAILFNSAAAFLDVQGE